MGAKQDDGEGEGGTWVNYREKINTRPGIRSTNDLKESSRLAAGTSDSLSLPFQPWNS